MGLFGTSSSSAGTPCSTGKADTPTPRFSTSLKNNAAAVNMVAEVEANADTLFTLLADPDKHTNIFEAIEGATCRLLEEEGPRRKYELDYRARWRFWRVSGVCDNRLHMETDSEAGTVSFKLREPGFLKVYEGTWSIVPAGESALRLYSRNKQQRQQQQGWGASLHAHSHHHSSHHHNHPVHQCSVGVQTEGGSPKSSSSGSATPGGLFNSLFGWATPPSSTPTHASSSPSASSPSSPTFASPLPSFSSLSPLSSPASSSGGSSSGEQSQAAGAPVQRKGSVGAGDLGVHPSIAGLLASVNNPLLELSSRLSQVQGPSSGSSITTTTSASLGSEPASQGSLAACQQLPPRPRRSVIQVHNLVMAPKVGPPSPLAGLLKGHAESQVQDMLHGLLAAARELDLQRESSALKSSGAAKAHGSSNYGAESSAFEEAPAIAARRKSLSLPGPAGTQSGPHGDGGLSGKKGVLMVSHAIQVVDGEDATA